MAPTLRGSETWSSTSSGPGRSSTCASERRGQRVGQQGGALVHGVAPEQMVQPAALDSLGGDRPGLATLRGERRLGVLGQQQAAQPAGRIGQRGGDGVQAVQPDGAARRVGAGPGLGRPYVGRAGAGRPRRGMQHGVAWPGRLLARRPWPARGRRRAVVARRARPARALGPVIARALFGGARTAARCAARFAAGGVVLGIRGGGVAEAAVRALAARAGAFLSVSRSAGPARPAASRAAIAGALLVRRFHILV